MKNDKQCVSAAMISVLVFRIRAQTLRVERLHKVVARGRTNIPC
jgi:hypothetical protein